jgi:protoheme IX farnesyltransferase
MPTKFSNYLELTKPRVTMLVAFSAMVGFELGRKDSFQPLLFAVSLAATLLLAGGSAALNMWMEAGPDALMLRTRNRPIPSGRIARPQALIFGLAVSAAGFSLFYLGANPVSAWVGLATAASYLLLYTPMKRISSLSTIVGAVPGALPPVMGWAASSGRLEAGAWALFAIMFLWQIPHFLSIACLYREDYQRGGFKVMPIFQDESGLADAGKQMILYALALIPVSLAPTLLGVTGGTYFFGAMILGLAFAGFSFAAAWTAQAVQARRVLLASVTYLPFLQGLMIFDKIR